MQLKYIPAKDHLIGIHDIISVSQIDVMHHQVVTTKYEFAIV
jgi:hypothetical protein